MSVAPEDVRLGGASCAVWRDGPAWNGLRTAAVGRFLAPDAAQGAALLEKVADRLAAQGVEAILGPMDGDTWHSYRLVVESDGSPPYLMEPRGAPHDPAAFAAAGFQPVSRYVSARASVEAALAASPPLLGEAFTVRAWDGRDAESFVLRLFELSRAEFARAAFFKPIERAAFLELYKPIMAAVDPRLVLFAFDGRGEIAGYLFGTPNRLEGPNPTTAILKTYASRARGAGRALADAFHRTIHDLGYREVIHALMHERNASLRRSGQYGATVFRRYALMGRKLSP